MPSRRKFLTQTAAVGFALATAKAVAQTQVRKAPMTNFPARVKLARTGAKILAVRRREDTILRYGGHGDNWHMSWAADDRQYVSLCDGVGFTERPAVSYNSRMFAISGGPENATFHGLPGYPLLGTPSQGPRDTRYYNFGTLALDGHLYQFLSTINREFRSEDLDATRGGDLLRFNGVKLIFSPDGGRTWHNQDRSTPVTWESWDRRSSETMVFLNEDQEAFSLLTVLQMGKNYEDNRDGYVYVYAPNGNADGVMNELVMFRVPKREILNRSSYEYFAGRQGRGAKWTKDITCRAVVHTFPRGWVNTLVHPYAWHPSVVYNAALDTYLMANWGMGAAPDGMWFGRPSYLGFWIAHHPWGPWTQIHEETSWLPAGDTSARAYQPQIAPKWIAADGRSFWLVWTDLQGIDSPEVKRLQDEFVARSKVSNFDYGEYALGSATMMRKYTPYYAFNVQRVDLFEA